MSYDAIHPLCVSWAMRSAVSNLIGFVIGGARRLRACVQRAAADGEPGL